MTSTLVNLVTSPGKYGSSSGLPTVLVFYIPNTHPGKAFQITDIIDIFLQKNVHNDMFNTYLLFTLLLYYYSMIQKI